MDNNRWREARAAVRGPATLLIVIGALSLAANVINVLGHDSMPGQVDEIITNVENDKNLTPQQKNEQINFWQFVKDALENPLAIVWAVVSIIYSFLVIVGAIRMMQLSGPALPTISAVLSMLPCTVSCCCLLGLPVGIWAFVVLYRPDVRAAMAVRNFEEASRDNSDIR